MHNVTNERITVGKGYYLFWIVLDVLLVILNITFVFTHEFSGWTVLWLLLACIWAWFLVRDIDKAMS